MTKALLTGFCLLALPATMALGQTKPAAGEAWQAVFFDAPTRALPLLMGAAVRHSADLKALELDKALSEQDLQVVKKGLLNSVALGAGYLYGNQASIALADPNNTNQFTTFSSGRYQAGVTFSLPLGQVASRGNLIRREQLNYQRNEAMRQERENLLRQQIIGLYQNVLLGRKLFTLQQEALVNTRTNYQLAEKQFRQGQITLQELSAANGQLTAVSVAQESARNQYDTAFMLLEEVVGAKVSTLMTAQAQ